MQTAAAWGLFNPSPCNEPAMLLSRIVPIARSSELTNLLGRVKALHGAGRFEQALTDAQALLEQARARKDRGFSSRS